MPRLSKATLERQQICLRSEQSADPIGRWREQTLADSPWHGIGSEIVRPERAREIEIQEWEPELVILQGKL
jgi:hypothetical protein